MDREQFIMNSCKSFREIQNMLFGKERRTQLLLWLQTQTKEMSWHMPYGFIVNRRHHDTIRTERASRTNGTTCY